MTMTTDLAARELRPGEHLLWSGQGDPSVVFQASDAFIIPFSLLWGGFAIFWEVSALRSGIGLFPSIFGGAFVIVGLYLIIGRFFAKAFVKRTTVYAVTNQRAFSTNGRSTRETAVQGQRSTTWSRSRSHVSVVWDAGTGLGGPFGVTSGLFRPRRSSWPGNSGLDIIGGNRAFGFYDVRDGQALVEALSRAV
jgi:hypothetical protein